MIYYAFNSRLFLGYITTMGKKFTYVPLLLSSTFSTTLGTQPVLPADHW